MASLKIKFSHVYPKLANQTSAKLLDVRMVRRDKLDTYMLELDTEYLGAGDLIEHYPLPNGLLLVLTFQGNRLIPFTTIRRYTSKKADYYESCIGKEFDIAIIHEEPRILPESVQEEAGIL